MTLNARYVHTNLIVQDWRKLARFYQEVFGCIPVPPERDLEGEWLEKATGVPGAHIRGVHLRLPGCGDCGPTLEMFEYQQMPPRAETQVHRPGFGHVSFAVDDVAAARQVVLDAGGGELGQLVALEVPGAGIVTFVYLTDPEGNILELQSWSKPAAK